MIWRIYRLSCMYYECWCCSVLMSELYSEFCTCIIMLLKAEHIDFLSRVGWKDMKLSLCASPATWAKASWNCFPIFTASQFTILVMSWFSESARQCTFKQELVWLGLVFGVCYFTCLGRLIWLSICLRLLCKFFRCVNSRQDVYGHVERVEIGGSVQGILKPKHKKLMYACGSHAGDWKIWRR